MGLRTASVPCRTGLYRPVLAQTVAAEAAALKQQFGSPRRTAIELQLDGDLSDEDKVTYVRAVIRGKLLESPTLRQQAAANSKEQFANSPDFGNALMDAIIGALDAHQTLSSQALNSAQVRDGIKEILLYQTGLYEDLRNAG